MWEDDSVDGRSSVLSSLSLSSPSLSLSLSLSSWSSFVCSLVRLLHRSFAPSFVCQFLRLSVPSFVSSFVCQFLRLRVPSFVSSFLCEFLPSVCEFLLCEFLPSVCEFLRKFVNSKVLSESVPSFVREFVRDFTRKLQCCYGLLGFENRSLGSLFVRVVRWRRCYDETTVVATMDSWRKTSQEMRKRKQINKSLSMFICGGFGVY